MCVSGREPIPRSHLEVRIKIGEVEGKVCVFRVKRRPKDETFKSTQFSGLETRDGGVKSI